ncbi:hypothetical protein FACS189475_06090 [Betaproteobacteria bacterium]|nr:hypothetical protein FACS189475_06090 [Betaproteobacteria bacterium]
MNNKTLDDFLDSVDGAGAVLAHAKRLIELGRLYQEIVPAYLRKSSRLANYHSGSVLIHAVNGATATKLRQLTSTLAEGFSRRGVECHEVRIKVRASDLPAPSGNPAQPIPKPLSAQVFQTLGGLCDSLPDSELRRAVETLISRSARV